MLFNKGNSKQNNRYKLAVFSLMIESQRLLLRSVRQSDLTTNYLCWLHDDEVNQYLESRFQEQSMDTIYAYWKQHHNDLNSPWFAIVDRDLDKHIGNIKLGPIDWVHERGEISLFIGEKSYWGKGYASEAINALKTWAFREIGIQKLTAGIYTSNIASRKAFEKAGFTIEGTLRSEKKSSCGRVDLWIMGLPRSLWVQ